MSHKKTDKDKRAKQNNQKNTKCLFVIVYHRFLSGYIFFINQQNKLKYKINKEKIIKVFL